MIFFFFLKKDSWRTRLGIQFCHGNKNSMIIFPSETGQKIYIYIKQTSKYSLKDRGNSFKRGVNSPGKWGGVEKHWRQHRHTAPQQPGGARITLTHTCTRTYPCMHALARTGSKAGAQNQEGDRTGRKPLPSTSAAPGLWEGIFKSQSMHKWWIFVILWLMSLRLGADFLSWGLSPGESQWSQPQCLRTCLFGSARDPGRNTAGKLEQWAWGAMGHSKSQAPSPRLEAIAGTAGHGPHLQYKEDEKAKSVRRRSFLRVERGD